MLPQADFYRVLAELPKVPYDVHPEPDGSYTYHIRQRMHFTLSCLAPVVEARRAWSVLDLGAFPGSFLRALPATWPGHDFRFEAAGLAENAEFLADLHRLGIPWHRVNLDPAFADARALPTRLPIEEPRFDLIVATEIVEHLLEPTHLLREARRLALPDALLVVTTPNLATLYRRLAFLVRGQSPNVPISQGLMEYRGDWRPHVREFTASELREILARSGWRVTEVHPYNAGTDRAAAAGLRRRLVDKAWEIGSRVWPDTATDLLLLARPC